VSVPDTAKEPRGKGSTPCGLGQKGITLARNRIPSSPSLDGRPRLHTADVEDGATSVACNVGPQSEVAIGFAVLFLGTLSQSAQAPPTYAPKDARTEEYDDSFHHP